MNTKDGEVFKQQITRYFKDGKRVPAGTPGAEAVVKETKLWYGRVKEPATGKWKLVPLLTDKRLSRKKLEEIERDLECGELALVDQFKSFMRAPIQEHVE